MRSAGGCSSEIGHEGGESWEDGRAHGDRESRFRRRGRKRRDAGKHGRHAFAIHWARTARAEGLCSSQITRPSDGLAPLLDTDFNSYIAETRSMGIDALLSDERNARRCIAATALATARCGSSGPGRARRATVGGLERVCVDGRPSGGGGVGWET